MTSRASQVLIATALLGVAIVGGWFATNLLQETVPIVPGVQGCTRLEGTARQITCLSDEFVEGAGAAAAGSRGSARDQEVIEYVRRAEKLAATDADLAGLCHPAMHQLGQREGKRAAGETRTPAFPDGSSQLCTAGYVHGLAEGYLATSPKADVAAVYPKLCHDQTAREGCAHGIGHALLKAEDTSSWLDATPRAIDRCAELPVIVAGNCDNGVYMELAMRTTPQPVAPRQYIRICDDARSIDQELACWGYLRTNLISNDVPTTEAAAWCTKASLPAQFPCIDGVGRDLGVARVPACLEVSERPALQERCVDGAVGLQVGSGHVTPATARAACQKIGDRPLERYCARAVQRYLQGKQQVEARS